MDSNQRPHGCEPLSVTSQPLTSRISLETIHDYRSMDDPCGLGLGRNGPLWSRLWKVVSVPNYVITQGVAMARRAAHMGWDNGESPCFGSACTGPLGQIVWHLRPADKVCHPSPFDRCLKCGMDCEAVRVGLTWGPESALSQACTTLRAPLTDD